MKKYPMHILSISQYGSGLSQTGAQFSGALGRQGDYAHCIERYSIIVPSETGSEEPIQYPNNLTIHPVIAKGNVHFFIRAYGRALRVHREYTAHAIMVDNPHVIGLVGALLKWRLNVPLVVHSMSDMIGNVWYLRERLSNRIKALFIACSVAAADLIRVSTEHEVERLRARGISEKKIARVPFYIDVEEFREKVAASGAVGDARTILFVGRLGPQKDVATLLSAMAVVKEQYPDAMLVIVGDGPDRQKLVALARNLNIERNVSFKGKIPYAQVVDYFKRATVFAISSLHEGTCMVLHEAAVAGKPLVATACAGAVDFIRDGVEGYVVPIRDHQALAGKISAILNDETLARSMGEAAKARMDAFTKDRALALWAELVSHLATMRGVSS